MRSCPDGCCQRFQVLIRTEAELVRVSDLQVQDVCTGGSARLVCVEEKGVEVFQAFVAQINLGGFTSIFYATNVTVLSTQLCAGSHKCSFYFNVHSLGKMILNDRL